MTRSEEAIDYISRQRELAEIAREDGIHATVLNPGPSLVYFTGLHFHLMERPVVVIVCPDKPLVIVLPELEARKLDALRYDYLPFTYGENPAEWADAFMQAVGATESAAGKLGIEPRSLRVLEYNYLEEAAPDAYFTSAARAISKLRVQKSPAEITAMRAAVDVAQRALKACLSQIRLGMTEKALSAELVMQLLRAGTDTPLPFSPIVAFGPNSANPHAIPTDRTLSLGDMILVDWGASVDGYVSDITRVFVAGEAELELSRIARIVEDANRAAREAAGPGVPARVIDQAARETIAKGGYGEYFTHRTGHGLGMEGHEEPYIRADNLEPLKPGMTFTIEPGIYQGGRGGVRIEDDMVITGSGAESMTTLPRGLSSLPLSP
jgi:Xaa-Pro dipeptidase